MSQETDSAEDSAAPATHQYRGLLRDVLLLQLKLSLDAMRDFALIPVSLACLVAGAVRDPKDPGRYYRELMYLGRRSDRWINLFGEFDGDEAKTDLYVRKVEDVVVREYQRRRQLPQDNGSDQQ